MTVKRVGTGLFSHLQLALMLVAACCLAASAEKLHSYTHPVGKFIFDYPAGAKAVLGADDLEGTKSDSVTIGWKMGTLGVRLMKMPLEKAIKETGALEKGNDGKWYRPGRFSRGVSHAVQPFGKLTGVYCTSDCASLTLLASMRRAGRVCRVF